MKHPRWCNAQMHIEVFRHTQIARLRKFIVCQLGRPQVQVINKPLHVQHANALLNEDRLTTLSAAAEMLNVSQI